MADSEEGMIRTSATDASTSVTHSPNSALILNLVCFEGGQPPALPLSYFFMPPARTGDLTLTASHENRGCSGWQDLLSKCRCAFQCAYFTSFFSAIFTGTYDLLLTSTCNLSA